MKVFLNRIHKKVYLTLFIISSGILYLKVISPVFGIHISCPFRQLTGFYCPGCGMTRAAIALLDGQIYQSFRFNMLIFLILPLLLLYYLLEKQGKVKQSKLLMGVMLVLTVLFGILRNFTIFDGFAPTKI
ncbi:DUF2752 domain-containing protein [Amphibacillus sp. Q70]|uniref:DUF2752 domain-containing protein n=1 Tax=Amphibacillus sp. Q70 TaxID=3453416 RepID=UPI003F874770